MQNFGITSLISSPSLKPNSPQPMSAAQMSNQFGDFLNDALNKLTEQQTTVDKLNQKFITGELVDVHKLLIASEKASLGLELTLQVRNKVIEAYQEVMRTQI